MWWFSQLVPLDLNSWLSPSRSTWLFILFSVLFKNGSVSSVSQLKISQRYTRLHFPRELRSLTQTRQDTQ